MVVHLTLVSSFLFPKKEKHNRIPLTITLLVRNQFKTERARYIFLFKSEFSKLILTHTHQIASAFKSYN